MKTKQTSLTANQILEKILHSKGQFVKAVFKSNPKPAAAHKGVVLEKRTSAVCRAGIDFANLSSVKVGIEEGTRGEVQELPWGEWFAFPYLIKHNDSMYVRLYPSDTKANTLFFVNGETVDRDKFATYLTPSEAKKLTGDGERPECFTIKMENILSTEDFNG
jgi:hypothetical protein